MTAPLHVAMESSYSYHDASLNASHAYLLPRLAKILDGIGARRAFELGCGNGAVASWLHDRGIDVTGVDASESGIQQAARAYPTLKLAVGSAYDDLAGRYGQYPMVISLEVIEHLYSPRIFAKTVFDLLEPGGRAIVSTPYHGYVKNLALAATGRFDSHFTALWDGGHIKFWSERTLRSLLEAAGFRNISFCRVGRIPVLAKSMIAIATKPA
jgi:2-polyprenyl-6-hydroxyphenyl methylase/3-demethylubiquinone-9 3-methyltransferase